jgi:hypothetical protein
MNERFSGIIYRRRFDRGRNFNNWRQVIRDPTECVQLTDKREAYVGSRSRNQSFQPIDAPSSCRQHRWHGDAQHRLRQRSHRGLKLGAGPIGIADFERVSEMHPIEGFEKQRSNRRWPACNAEIGKSWKMNDARPITESGEKLDFKKFEIEGVKPKFALKTTEDIKGRIAATNVEIVLKTRDQPTGGLGRRALKFRGAGKRIPSADQRAECRESVSWIGRKTHNARRHWLRSSNHTSYWVAQGQCFGQAVKGRECRASKRLKYWPKPSPCAHGRGRDEYPKLAVYVDTRHYRAGELGIGDSLNQARAQ